MSIDIGEVITLNNQASRIFAGLYRVTRILKEELSLDQYSSLYKSLKGKVQPDAKNQLSNDQLKKLGGDLSYIIHVIHHVKIFRDAAISLLVRAGSSAKVLDLSWNYVFVHPIMALLTNYVKITLFVCNIQDLGKVQLLYEYAYKKIANCEIPILSGCELPESTAKVFAKNEKILNQLSEAIYPMFKSLAVSFQRVLGPATTFEWSTLNISDNPSPVKPMSNSAFFKNDYLLMMNLNEIVDWFFCFALLNTKMVAQEQALSEIFQLLALHKNRFEFNGECTIMLKEVFDQQRKVTKADLDTSNFDDSLVKKSINEQNFKRRRLAMAVNECLIAVQGDPEIAALKMPIVLSLLGFANFEIRTCLSSPVAVDNGAQCLTLIDAVFKLVTLVIRSEEEIRRFTVYNLREYDAPYLNSLIHSFNIPEFIYDQLEKLAGALKTIDIEQYDHGTIYDLSGTIQGIYRIVAAFNQYSMEHGILHLSPLFNLLSCTFFHLRTAQSSIKLVLESAPLQKYWAFLPIFKNVFALENNPDIQCLPSLIGITHYFSLDFDILSEYPLIKTITEQYVLDSIKALNGVLEKAARNFYDTLNDLSSQDSFVSGFLNVEQPSAPNKAFPWKPKKKVEEETKSLKDILTGQESTLALRYNLDAMATHCSNVGRIMHTIKEIGVINIFGKKVNIVDKFLNSSKDLIGKILSNAQFAPPNELIKQVDNAKFVMMLLFRSANVNPYEYVKSSMEQLLKVKVNITDSSVTVDNKVGSLISIYKSFFKDYFTKHIANTMYSIVQKAFIPLIEKTKKQSQTSIDSIPTITLSWLKSLYNLIGINGMICIDVLAAENVKKLMENLSSSIQPCIPKDSKKISTIETSRAEELLSLFGRIGALLSFRHLLREAIDYDVSRDSKYSFMAKDLNPTNDLILNSMIKESGLVIVFKDNSNISLISAPLFAAPIYDKSKYLPQHDGFDDNSHLIINVFDALIGCILFNDKKFDYQTKLKQFLLYASIGIKNIDKKKGNDNNLLQMYLIIDHLVKNSRYLDYSMLEPIVPYQYIRSIYTLIIGNLKV